MRILVIFIDMVRVDYLHSYHQSAKACLLDKQLEKLGGTIFTRCYSPGPDTPRSLACMQSGLFPHFNGCDTRIKWPKFFMKDEVSTIWNHASDDGWNVNLCCRKNECLTGFFNYHDSSKIHLFYDIDGFINGSVFRDNSISFIGIPDMHTAISDYMATDYSFRKGDEIVNLCFDKYFTDEFDDQFDYIIVFSDHGFQKWDEGVRKKSALELLNDGRNQLLMMIHKKGDTGIKKDNRLSSMVDLYATLESLIGRSEFRQGYSLLDNPQRTIAHVEDHKEFTVYPEIMVKQWRVISDTFDIRTNINETIIDKGGGKDMEIVNSYLSEYSPSYLAYMKQLKVLDYYETLNKEEKIDNYFVGLERPSSTKLSVYQFLFTINTKYTLLKKRLLK